MEVVINGCFGGFGLSEAGVRAYWKRKGKQVHAYGRRPGTSYFDEPKPDAFRLPEGEYFMPRDHPEFERYNKWYSDHTLYDRDIPRDDSDLVAVVKELGDAANDEYAKLRIVEIPDGVKWRIEEYDGNEHVAEEHRTWA